MDYGNLFSKAWRVIWDNKFLIVLGMLVVLGSASGNSGTQGSLPSFRADGGGEQLPQFYFDPPDLNIGGGLEIAVIALIALIILTIIVVFWVISTVARGGLIHGAYTVDSGGTSSFSQAFSEGWSRVFRLLGISLVPAIPTFLLMVVSFFSIIGYTSIEIVNGGASVIGTPNWLLIPALAVVCFLALASLVLSLLRTFANRACMIEDTGVFASYRRGLEVLGQNFGSALLLFILQIGLSLLLALVLFLPGILLALCCLLWPVLLIAQGTFAAYFSTLWTLAWSQWTNDAAPAEATAA